jgi:hypothetical protein
MRRLLLLCALLPLGCDDDAPTARPRPAPAAPARVTVAGEEVTGRRARDFPPGVLPPCQIIYTLSDGPLSNTPYVPPPGWVVRSAVTQPPGPKFSNPHPWVWIEGPGGRRDCPTCPGGAPVAAYREAVPGYELFNLRVYCPD